MKRKLLKSLRMLLVAAGLCVGANAWADAGDVTTLFSIDFSNPLVATGSNYATGVPNYTCEGSAGTMAIHGGRWSSTAYNPSISEGGTLYFVGEATAVITPNANVKDIVTFEFDIANSNLTGKNIYFRIYDNSATPAVIAGETYTLYNNVGFSENTFGFDLSDMNSAGNANSNFATHNHIKIDFNYETGKATAKITKFTNTTTEGASVTKTVDFDNSKQLSKFVVGSNYTTRYPQFDNLVITKTEGDYSTTANITLAFQDDSDNDISGLYTGQTDFTVDKNTTFTPSDYYPTAMYDGDYKYTYTSGGDAFTVTGDQTVTLVYTKGDRPTHTLNVTASYGSKNLTIVNNVSVLEESNHTYYYPKYIKDGNTLYEYTSSTDPGASATYWTSTTAVGTSNVSYTLTYKAIEGECVYYSEGENIDSKTGTFGYFSPVSSGGTTGVLDAAEGNLVTSLPAGVYTITARTVGRGDGDRNIYFYKNSVSEENKILTCTPGTSGATATSGAITITESTNVLVNNAPGGGQNGRGLDYVYIMKTADVVPFTLGAESGDSYKSFVTTGNTDFATLGVTAYIAKAADTAKGTVTLSTIDNAPAGIPVLLKGTKGNTAVITTTSTDYDAPETNYLVAADGETAIGSSEAKYVLAYNSGWEFRHYNGTLSAGKVYLDLSSLGGGAAKLSFIFDEETTGIKSVQGSGLTVNGYYNLNGQRVNQPSKGLYIVNGKKVIIK